MKWTWLLLIMGVLFVVVGCQPTVEQGVEVVSTRPVKATAVSVEMVLPTETASPTKSASPTATTSPVETEVVTEFPVVTVERLPMEQLNGRLTAADQYMAYALDGVLYAQDVAQQQQPIEITRCDSDAVRCGLPLVRWSGSRLAYEWGDNVVVIDVVTGQKSTLKMSSPSFFYPVTWSPDGTMLAFMMYNGHPWGNIDAEEITMEVWLSSGFLHEVWQVAVAPDGQMGEPERVGEARVAGQGCGGGGRSESDGLYDSQGGFGLGFSSIDMVWGAEDVLIYSLTCDFFRGYARLDMRTGQALSRLSGGELRGLRLRDGGQSWVAITGHNLYEDEEDNRLMTGTVRGDEVEVLETAVPVEMVFVVDDMLYYSSRTKAGQDDLSGKWAASNLFSPYFRFYETDLWRIDGDGSNEQLLWEGDVYAIVRLFKMAENQVAFVAIDNDYALYEVATTVTINDETFVETWPDYLPQTDVMLVIEGEGLGVWIEGGRNLAVGS